MAHQDFSAALSGSRPLSPQPGITEFVIHVGFDNEELRAATRERATWGAAWRQRDYDFFSSGEFRALLDQQHIKLITWRELAKARKSP